MVNKLATKLLLADLSKLSDEEQLYIQNLASMKTGHTPGNMIQLKKIMKKHKLLREGKEDFSDLGGHRKKS